MAAPHLLQSYLATDAGDFDDAFVHARRAVDLEPGNAAMRSGLASMLLARGDYLQALEHADAAERIHPTITRAGQVRAWANYLLGEFEAAETAARSQVERYPVQVDVVLIATLQAMGRTRDVQREIDRLLMRDPDFRVSELRLPKLERFSDPRIKAEFVQTLIAAGLPE